MADQKGAAGLNVTFKKHIKPCAYIKSNRMKRQLLLILKMLVSRFQGPSRGLGMLRKCQAIPRYIHYRAFLIIKDCLKKQRDERKIRETRNERICRERERTALLGDKPSSTLLFI